MKTDNVNELEAKLKKELVKMFSAKFTDDEIIYLLTFVDVKEVLIDAMNGVLDK